LAHLESKQNANNDNKKALVGRWTNQEHQAFMDCKLKHPTYFSTFLKVINILVFCRFYNSKQYEQNLLSS